MHSFDASINWVAPATVTNGTITLTAQGSDPDGSITKVEFYDGFTKIGEATTAPYTIQWKRASAGIHTVQALAWDNKGNHSISDGVTLFANGSHDEYFINTFVSTQEGFRFNPRGDNVYVFPVSTNTPSWTAVSNLDKLSLTVDGVNNLLYVKVSPHRFEESLIGMITFISAGANIRSDLPVTIDGVYIRTDVESTKIPTLGGQKVIHVTSNAPWSVSSTAKWYTYTASGFSSTEGYVVAEAVVQDSLHVRNGFLQFQSWSPYVTNEVQVQQDGIILNATPLTTLVGPGVDSL